MSTFVSANNSGYTTPDFNLEAVPPVHPTAVRRPHAIVVQSENTSYTDEHITAKFTNRDSEVTVTDGLFSVKPTVQEFEFQTKRAPSKTGFVIFLAFRIFARVYRL